MRQRLRWSLAMALLVAVSTISAMSLGDKSVVRAEGIPVWFCRAEGTYTTCPASRAWRPCQERRLEGKGAAWDRTSACMDAERSCTESLLRALMLESKQGNANVKSRCAITHCEIDSLETLTQRMLSPSS